MSTAAAETAVPDTHRDILDKAGFGHLATTGPDGEPQSVPVWYAAEGGRVKVSTTKSRQKYRNVQRDPRVSLSITDPDDPYRYLEIRGKVIESEDDRDKLFIDRLAQKYMDLDEYPDKDPGAERVTLHIEPQHTTTMG